MVNKDILGGLRSALVRGYSLEEAMRSFLNGGYKKEEIEEAAHALQTQFAEASAPSGWSPQPIWARQKTAQPVLLQKPAKIGIPSKQTVTKGVAAYSYGAPRMKFITILLIVLLVVLLGILGLMYVFRDQIIDFFNGLF